ncbi:exodeoxyribonuclease V subunit gamma [Candidatus Fermentibacteria bacterium]|nr:exodeoxyribonuclease V subunit gamma [Candidatus Fermentibacteria bacterium]
MARDVVLAPSFPLLLHRLVARVCAHHHDDPLVSEIILVPNAPVARFVESALAAASPAPLLNVQVIPIRWAPQRLAPRDVHIPEPPAPLLLEGAARRLLRRHIPAMAVLDGAERALMATFTDLLDAGFIDKETVREFGASLSVEGQDRQTLKLYALWLELLTKAGLVPAQIAFARSSWPVEARWLHVFGFLRVEGVLADMIDRWAHASSDMDVAHYFPCHPDALSGKLFGYDYVAGHVEQAHLHHVSERIRAPAYSSGLFPEIDAILVRDTPGGNAMHDVRLDQVGFIAAAGEAGEVEAAARIVAEALAEPSRTVRPEDLAVLASDISLYEPFIRSIFAEMDLPVRWLHPVSAGQHPAVRWMSTLLSLPQGGFSAVSVRELLGSPFVRLPAPWDAEDFTLLDAKLREMGSTPLAGDEWRARWCDKPGEPWAELAAAFVGELKASFGAQSCGGFVELMQGFLNRWVTPKIIEDDGVLAAWVRGIECLRDLDTLGYPDDEPAGDIARVFCHDALEGVSLPGAQQARGVMVGSMSAASGMAFDRVVIMGANRGRLPRQAREDPLLSDAARSRIAADLGYGVPLASDAPRRDKLLFVLTILSARERAWVTYQHASANGDAKSPSLFFPLIFGEHADQVIQFHTDRSSRLTQIVERGEHHLTAREAARLILGEGDSRRVGMLTSLLGQAFTSGLDRARAVLRAREGTEATIFDVGAAAPRDAIVGALGSTGAWRDLDACPFRFFLGRVLRIPEPGETAGLWQPTMLDRGKLLHKALEMALLPGIPAKHQCRQRAQEAWEAARTWYLSEHRHADLPGFVALELDQVAQWFVPTLEEEIRLVARRRQAVGEGLRVGTEQSYDGMLTLDGERIPLRVRFDRLESHRAAGKSVPLRIVDYKLHTREKSIDRDAINLQAFLYAEAIESAQGIRPDTEYVEIVPESLPAQTLSVDATDRTAKDLFRRKASHLLRSALAGVWHLREEPVTCAYCPYSRVCRRYDSTILGKATRLRREHDAVLKDLDRELTKRLKPTLSQRYGGDE